MSDLAGGEGGGNGPESGSVAVLSAQQSPAVEPALDRSTGPTAPTGPTGRDKTPVGGSWAPLSGHVRPAEAIDGQMGTSGDTPAAPCPFRRWCDCGFGRCESKSS